MIGKLLAIACGLGLISWGLFSETVNLEATAELVSSPLEQVIKNNTEKPLDSFPNKPASKLIKIEAIISEPSDIKVNPGQLIKAGEILADRTKERSQLEFQKNQLKASYNQLNSYNINDPTPPSAAPEMLPLPDADYSTYLAQINKAKLKVNLAARQAGLAGAVSNVAPDSILAEIEDKKQRLVEAERLLEMQEKKAEAIRNMNLPSYYQEHEEVKLKEAQQGVELAKSDLSTSEGKSSDAVAVNQGKLAELHIALEMAAAELRLAESELEKAKSERLKEEYQHSLNLARRIEEANQAKSFYEQEKNKALDSRRDLEYKKASILSQVNMIDEKLNAIAVVKAPFNGEIRRVKINSQINNNLSATISVVTSDPGAVSPNSPEQSNPFSN